MELRHNNEHATLSQQIAFKESNHCLVVADKGFSVDVSSEFNMYIQRILYECRHLELYASYQSKLESTLFLMH